MLPQEAAARSCLSNASVRQARTAWMVALQELGREGFGPSTPGITNPKRPSINRRLSQACDRSICPSPPADRMVVDKEPARRHAVFEAGPHRRGAVPGAEPLLDRAAARGSRCCDRGCRRAGRRTGSRLSEDAAPSIRASPGDRGTRWSRDQALSRNGFAGRVKRRAYSTPAVGRGAQVRDRQSARLESARGTPFAGRRMHSTRELEASGLVQAATA